MHQPHQGTAEDRPSRQGSGDGINRNAPPGSGSAVRGLTGINSVIVNKRQRGNPVLDLIRNAAWEYGEANAADYVVGRTTGILFLSIKYHRLYPEYIHQRIKDLGTNFELRILLVLVDVDNHPNTMRALSRICVTNNLTLLMACSKEECARYIEIYKAIEHKPPDVLKGKQESDYMSRLSHVLTQIKGVNRTDVLTLSANFQTFENIVKASITQLAACTGIGQKKAQRIYDAFRQPFKAFVDK